MHAPLLGVAGVAVVSGVLAVVTGAAWSAATAGVASVATAVLAVRATHTAPTPSADRIVSLPEPQRSQPVESRLPAAQTPAPAPERTDDATSTPDVFDVGGLFNPEFVQTTLRGRVAGARRALRPLSLLYFEVLELGDPVGKRPVAPVAVADVLRRTLREADTAGFAEGGCYACILEDTGEDGAVWTAERIRRNLAAVDPGRRFRAGIASYPNHALDATELQVRARRALDVARDWSRDRIEVATGG